MNDLNPVFFANPPPRDTLTMQAANGQKIIIHLATGEVDLCGLTPSEGARLFWDTVSRTVFGGRLGASGVGPGAVPGLRRD
jgi:hypothetical protein